MREVVKDVFAWSRLSEPHGYDFNGYLICLPTGNLCVDPVEPDEQTLAEITRRGVAQILITNRNHARAANRIRERTGARTVIHPADAEYARGQGAVIDEELHVGQKIGPLVVVGAHGKSPGEVALHWPQRRILIVGDAVIGNPPGRCGLLREKVMDDPARLRESVQALLALDFNVLLVGDGTPILEGAEKRLKELVASFPA